MTDPWPALWDAVGRSAAAFACRAGDWPPRSCRQAAQCLAALGCSASPEMTREASPSADIAFEWSADPSCVDVVDSLINQAAEIVSAAALAWAYSGLLPAPWPEVGARLAALLPDPPSPPPQPPQPVDAGRLSQGWQRVLEAFQPQQRRRRGVYLTPPAVARFLVRSVDQLIRRLPGWSEGLAAEVDGWSTTLLDPAAGSGVLLQAAAQQLQRTGLSPTQVAQRLEGRELLPFAAILANAVVQLQLQSPLPGFLSAAPLVRCSDALAAPWQRPDNRKALLAIVGNPPYGNFGRENRTPWILAALQDYKRGLREQKHNLDDQYVKFFRWAEHQVSRADAGLVAFITNSSYLRSLTFRGMRQHLLDSFDSAYLLDLHGQQFGADAEDQNVFPIRQGVTIGVFQRLPEGRRRRDCQVWFAERQGSRQSKLSFLDDNDLDTIGWQSLAPRAPQWRLAAAPAGRADYEQWPRLDQLLPQYVSGVQSKCDRFFIDRCRERLLARVEAALTGPAGRTTLPAWLQPRLETAELDSRRAVPCLVAPGDRRWIYYDPALLGRARFAVLQHLAGQPAAAGRQRTRTRQGTLDLHDITESVGSRDTSDLAAHDLADRADADTQPNTALLFMRQSTNAGPYDHVLACNCLATDRVFHSRHGAPYLAPWRLNGRADRPWNLSPVAESLAGVSRRPESLLHYIYALLHSTVYRQQFHSQLQRDFPRIPPAPAVELFDQLSGWGAQLAGLHSRGPADPLAEVPGWPEIEQLSRPQLLGDDGERTTISLGRQQIRLPTAAWHWRVGGLPVIAHWLASRAGTPPLPAERAVLPRLAATAVQTQQLVAQIDQHTQWL